MDYLNINVGFFSFILLHFHFFGATDFSGVKNTPSELFLFSNALANPPNFVSLTISIKLPSLSKALNNRKKISTFTKNLMKYRTPSV